MCISALGPSLCPSSSLVLSFIHSAFSLCLFGCHMFVQNRSVSLASGCWYVFVSCPPNCWWNFISLFCNVLFCLYCFTLFRYLFSLPSFARTFCVIIIIIIIIIICFFLIRTLLSILSNLNNAVVWIVSTLRRNSKSSSHCRNSLVTEPSVPLTISIKLTLIFQSSFSSVAESWYLSLFSFCFSFTHIS